MKRGRNSFLTPLVVEVMPSGKRFKVAREFTYKWMRKGIEVHIAVGTLTDFASIPRIARQPHCPPLPLNRFPEGITSTTNGVRKLFLPLFTSKLLC